MLWTSYRTIHEISKNTTLATNEENVEEIMKFNYANIIP